VWLRFTGGDSAGPGEIRDAWWASCKTCKAQFRARSGLRPECERSHGCWGRGFHAFRVDVSRRTRRTATGRCPYGKDLPRAGRIRGGTTLERIVRRPSGSRGKRSPLEVRARRGSGFGCDGPPGAI